LNRWRQGGRASNGGMTITSSKHPQIIMNFPCVSVGVRVAVNQKRSSAHRFFERGHGGDNTREEANREEQLRLRCPIASFAAQIKGPGESREKLKKGASQAIATGKAQAMVAGRTVGYTLKGARDQQWQIKTILLRELFKNITRGNSRPGSKGHTCFASALGENGRERACLIPPGRKPPAREHTPKGASRKPEKKEKQV